MNRKRRNNTSRRFGPSAVAAIALALLVPLTGFAQEGDEADAPGEVVFKTNAEFVRFTVNGKSNWDNHHFENRNRTLIIMGLTRGQENEIVLSPRVEGLEPQTFVLADADYKRKRIRRERRTVIVFQAVKKVKFAKPKPAAKATPKTKKAPPPSREPAKKPAKSKK